MREPRELAFSGYSYYNYCPNNHPLVADTNTDLDPNLLAFATVIRITRTRSRFSGEHIYLTGDVYARTLASAGFSLLKLEPKLALTSPLHLMDARTGRLMKM